MGTERELSEDASGNVCAGISVPTLPFPTDLVPCEPIPNLLGKSTTAAGTSSLIEHKSMLPLILEKIHDPNYPLAEVNRLISIEIAFITQDMDRLYREVEDGNHTGTFLQRSYVERIKALTHLEKSLTNGDIMRNRDILNFDGPKYQHMFGEIVQSFVRAATAALGAGGDTIIQSIMKHWRDEVAMNDARWRAETEKINSPGNQ
jgi:hypothetical protein